MVASFFWWIFREIRCFVLQRCAIITDMMCGEIVVILADYEYEPEIIRETVMKRNLILAFAAFAFAILIAGCGAESTGNEEADKALDALKLEEKAPMLGPVYRSFVVKFYKDDFDGCWDMIAKESQDEFGEMMKPRIDEIKEMDQAKIDETIKGLKKQLETIEDEKKKTQMEFQIKLYEAGKDDFKDLPDEKAYYVLFMQMTPKNIVLEEVKEIIKEEISEDGKTGHILYKEEDKEKKKKFVQEDGQWKLFFGSDD